MKLLYLIGDYLEAIGNMTILYEYKIRKYISSILYPFM